MYRYTHKILQNINTKQTHPCDKNTDMCYFMGSCFFVCCSLSIILHLWLTVTGPVNSLLVIFSPTGHFKNECLNIGLHTYILFVSIFSYKNTPLCITLHTQIQECCWDLKNSDSRKISRKFVSWNSAEKMWLAGISAKFLLIQPKLNKKIRLRGLINKRCRIGIS